MISASDNVAYDVAAGLGAIDDTIEIAGPRCKKATAMVAAVTIVAMVSTIETNRFGVQICTPTWALPDPTWPIPDPTWALPDLSLGSSRSQPGLLRSSAEIWKTPAKTWSRNQIKQPPCKPASQPAKPNQPNPAQPSQPTATTCHHASTVGEGMSGRGFLYGCKSAFLGWFEAGLPPKR